MFVASCPLRVSLFGGSTDNPVFIDSYGFGSVISFTSSLKTYAIISQDRFGFNKDHKYIINYSKREEVDNVGEIQNEVVRTVLDHYNMPPCQVTLTSDAYSQGSGLASSSSYTISLIKACNMFNNVMMTDNDICKLAHELELKYNPYCGYQDPYGCGVGGFKKMDFFKRGGVAYEFLPMGLFDSYNTHLVFSGVTRNSKKILEDVSKNIDKIYPLIGVVDDAYHALINEDYDEFFDLMNQSWILKKETSSYITENEKIVEIDKCLGDCDSVLSHKLCGAGNGGFFLTFSMKDTLSIPYDNVKINVVPNGVKGESI